MPSFSAAFLGVHGPPTQEFGQINLDTTVVG